MQRRSFLRSAVAGAAAIPFSALVRAQNSDAGVRRGHTPGYGPLVETLDQATGLPLIMLPQGFKYVSFGWTGDPLADGTPTPGSHDGMAAFDAGNGITRLVRNHERGQGPPFHSVQYDGAGAGGTTTLEFDTQKGALVSAVASISGTIRNCAGGPTPWGSWLTCEETVEYTTMAHGYIFEVPADGVGDPTPLRAMGRFRHEAVAVDPNTGYVYETEDTGNTSGFYRFVPAVQGNLAAGGQLQMLKIRGEHQANLTVEIANGTTYHVEWVPIATPDTDLVSGADNFVWLQGRALGAATFGRLEGCWYGNDGKVYVVSTSGRGSGRGQVWEYHPGEETLRMLFQSPGANVLNAPDNICVSPRGGLVLCEDGSLEEFMHGLTVEGEIFPFAKNNVVLNGEKNGIVGDKRGSEWAGACFSPDGRWLFANLQDPGITFAITGPWGAGAL